MPTIGYCQYGDLPAVRRLLQMAIKSSDRAVEERQYPPRYLDDELIQVPSMALERARMGLGTWGTDRGMLAKVRSALESGISNCRSNMTRSWCCEKRARLSCRACRIERR
jgi:hypothetical protein